MRWRLVVFVTIVAMATLSLSRSAAASEQARQRRKSPTMAFGIALGPGALLHGLGNYSAGERKTGAILFALELFGAGMVLADKGNSDSGEVLGGRSSHGALGMVGATLFFGSYLYDVFSAPGAAQRYNRRIEQNQQLTFQLEPIAPTSTTPLQPTFRFTKRF